VFRLSAPFALLLSLPCINAEADLKRKEKERKGKKRKEKKRKDKKNKRRKEKKRKEIGKITEKYGNWAIAIALMVRIFL